MKFTSAAVASIAETRTGINLIWNVHIPPGAGEHYEEDEVVLAWIWTLESCAEVDGVGGVGEFPPVGEGRRRTGELRV